MGCGGSRWLVLASWLVGCIPATQPRVITPTTAPLPPAPPTQTEPTGAVHTLDARIDGERLGIGGKLVSSEQVAAELGSRSDGVNTLAVWLAPNYDDDKLEQLLTAAARAEIASVELHRDGRTIAMPLRGRAPGRLNVWNHGAELQVYDADAASTSTVTANDVNAEQRLRDRLSAICKEAPCQVQMELTAGNDGQIWRLLDVWQRATAGLTRVTATLSAHPRGPSLGTADSGHLPPSLIQRVVRSHFPAVQKCYEAGLGRDSSLTGRVEARFIIGRDGKVSDIAASQGTSLPDAQVVSCVLNVFQKLEFPSPGDGPVTVVYPVMLAPG